MDPVSQSISGSLLCYIPRRESLLRAEESLDVILPDRFPDASEILSVSGRAVIKGYDRSSGSWSILLIAELRALFLSDSGETRILSAEIPVTVKSSLEGGEDGVPRGEAALIGKEARIVNSRKLSFSVSVEAALSVFLPHTAAGAPPEENGVVTKTAEREILARTVFAVERFTLRDDLALSAGSGPFGTVIWQECLLSVIECKTIHEKIVMRAAAKIRAAAMNESGIPESVEFELPFTRVFEIAGADEDCASFVRLSPGKLDLAPVGEEGKRAVSVTLEAEAGIECFRKTAYRYAEDAYGLSSELSLHRETLLLPVERSEEEAEERFLDAVEFPFDPESIHLFRAELSPARVFGNDEGRLRLETTLEAEFLYNAEGRMHALKKSFPVKRELAWDGGNASAEAILQTSRFTLPAMRKSEIEATILFRIVREEDLEVSFVTGWDVGSETAEDLPSYRILTPGKDISLFSLAKMTHSSPALIAEANGLSPDGDAPGGRLLLIPVVKGK